MYEPHQKAKKHLVVVYSIEVHNELVEVELVQTTVTKQWQEPCDKCAALKRTQMLVFRCEFFVIFSLLLLHAFFIANRHYNVNAQ